MLDKMISVSPPQKGETLDAKLADSKKFRDASGSEYRNEFEKALQKKLDLKLEQRKADLAEKKDAERRQQELRADKNDKKSLGGTKKRVTEEDDKKTVSNVMASNESKVETPESRTDAPAKVETVIPQNTEAKAGHVPSEKAVAASLAAALQAPAAEIAAESQSPLQALPVADAASQSELSQLMVESEQATLAPDTAAKAQNLSFEAELGAAVDFEADTASQLESQSLLQRMKVFESETQAVTPKAQKFEQDILSQLQKEQSFNVSAVPNKETAGQGMGSFEQSGSELKDMKSEPNLTNNLHQAAGQSHGDFKNHLQSVSATPDLNAGSRTEESREANIDEIMSQARYLVKKGGGEVTVKMSPEGMGEVQLKVLLQDGKLNVEMQTQDKNVKKLIEESLSDLKSGLAAHRLSLEHVKIDTVNATNADNNTQFQSNLNQGHSQGQAREFWNDFQGNMNNPSRRSSNPAENSSSGPSARSISAGASAAQTLRTYGGTKGATINRVA